MSQMYAIRLKLTSVLLPVALIAAGFVVVYSAFHWLVLIKWELVRLDRDVAVFWLPMALAWLVVLTVPRKRIRRLRWSGDGMLGYLLAWILLMAPTIVAQHHLDEVAGEKVELRDASELRPTRGTRFFTIAQVKLDVGRIGRSISLRAVGRSATERELSVFLACPFVWGPASPTGAQAEIWLGVAATKRLPSSLSSAAIELESEALVQAKLSRVMEFDASVVSYFRRVRPSTELRGYRSAVLATGGGDAGRSIVVLEARSDPWHARGDGALAWTLGTFAAGAGVWIGVGLLTEIARDRRREHRSATAAASPSGIRFFWPRHGFRAAPALAVTLGVVFLAMVLMGLGVESFLSGDLITWGANYAPRVLEGEYWRLGTSLFVHAGLVHLANNLTGLFLCGVLLEPVTGSKWFLGTFGSAGIAGGLLSMAWNPNVVSVGASGGIFGIIGFALVVLIRVKPPGADRTALLQLVWWYGGLNLVLGWIMPGVDGAAHSGGLIFGALLGLSAAPHLASPSKVPKGRISRLPKPGPCRKPEV